MPLKPKRRRRPDMSAEVILKNPSLRRHLLAGMPFFHTDSGMFATVDDLRDAWELTRDVLLPKFIEEHPGRRPFAWWLLDHGHERPILHENLAPYMTEEHLRRADRKEQKFGFLHTRTIPEFQEAERDYLERLGLLEFGELERIEAIEGEVDAT